MADLCRISGKCECTGEIAGVVEVTPPPTGPTSEEVGFTHAPKQIGRGTGIKIAPSFWTRQVEGAPETTEAKMEIIKLEDLHKALADSTVNKEDFDETKINNLFSNVTFYGSWFPEETAHQFDLAHKIIEAEGRMPGPALFMMEISFVPKMNNERFMSWLERRVGEWNGYASGALECAAEDCLMTEEMTNKIQNSAATASAWRDFLSPEQKERVKTIFRETYGIVSPKTFEWHERMGFMEKMLLVDPIAQLADIPEKNVEINEEYFKGNAKSILEKIKADHSSLEQHPKESAELIWNFFLTNYSDLFLLAEYWNSLSAFIENNPDYAERFIEQKELWPSLFNTENEASGNFGAARRFYVYIIYSELLVNNLVPEEKKVEIYLMLVKFDEPSLLEKYAKLGSVEAIEKEIICDYVLGVEAKNYSLVIIEALGKKLFAEFTKKMGGENFIAFLKERLPEEVSSKLNLTFRYIRLVADRSETAARQFLAEMADASLINQDAVTNDPLWTEMSSVFGDLPLFTIENNIETYTRSLQQMPATMITLGLGRVLKEFYVERHPYGAIYALPEEIRPTARGLSFVSIDIFPDVAVSGHPDKKDVVQAGDEKRYWKDEKEFSHGIFTSSLAVGETTGLAPQAKLYILPVNGDARGNSFPMQMLANLREVVELKKKDPTVVVAGLSLGLEVLQGFREVAKGSPMFHELQSVCEELYKMGVAIVISSGNSGSSEGLINMLGFLPHIQLIGAAVSHLTRTFTDDTSSEYSTGSDTSNPVRFWAHADPVFSPINKERSKWLAQGGTSSSQPHFSGTLLLMKDVNPTLTMDDCYSILQQTAERSSADTAVSFIDPMEALVVAAHLPGSRYQGDKLARFSKALGFDPATHKLPEIFPQKH